MNSRFALLALSIAIAVISLALFITIVAGTASSVSGEVIAFQQKKGMGEVADNRLLRPQGLSINQEEPLPLTEPISIYLPLVSMAGYIDKSAERAGLMAIYNSTNGASWYNNTGWGTDQTHRIVIGMGSRVMRMGM